MGNKMLQDKQGFSIKRLDAPNHEEYHVRSFAALVSYMIFEGRISIWREEMREIKFRAWDKNIEAMQLDLTGLHWFRSHPPFPYTQEAEGQLTGISFDSEEGEIIDEPVDDYILMQYTGLKDKNGQEIYEGDIITALTIDDVGREICEVYWSDDSTGWQARSNESDDELGAFVSGCEVIGNIYENPELLK